MTDMTRALSDPELGSTPFRVIRPAYRISQGMTSETTQVFSASGCIQPGRAETLKLLPEEERHENHIVIYTVFPLSFRWVKTAAETPGPAPTGSPGAGKPGSW